MSGKRKGGGKGSEYVEKRRKNNEAVHKSREKTRMLESETAERVKILKRENVDLERRVEVLNRELTFLKEMFVAYASGKGSGSGAKETKNKEPTSHTTTTSQAAAAFDAFASDPTPPSLNTRSSSRHEFPVDEFRIHDGVDYSNVLDEEYS